VYEKKGRCFSPSAQKMLVSSTSKQFNASTSFVHIEALHSLQRLLQEFLEFFPQLSIQASSLSIKLQLCALQLRQLDPQLHHPVYIKVL
jgi:hypothetical protein